MRLPLASLGLALVALGFTVSAHAGPRLVVPPAIDDVRAAGETKTAVLAGGCYWGMQAVFEHVKGVREVDAGLSGRPNLSNEAGLAGKADAPAEAIQITYDPGVISYGQILQLYFSVAHDPTEVDRQGPDIGPRYRSMIYYSDDQQKRIADAYVAQLQAAHTFAMPIATQVAPLMHFRKVEASQQDYVSKHLTTPYVVLEDLPKITALKALYPASYQEQAVAWPG